MAVRVEVLEDHLHVRFSALGSLAAMRRGFLIPYSTITRVDVAPPEWPRAMERWRVGTHLHRLVAKGSFVTWKGERRFWYIDRRTTRAVTIHLADHPSFDAVVLDVPEPDLLVRHIEGNRARKR